MPVYKTPSKRELELRVLDLELEVANLKEIFGREFRELREKVLLALGLDYFPGDP